uniref:Uncharacterized protein n=1 Tax=Craspedostauros australis TaxID=1486917 RepID=A0A7R9ZRL0_9STRA|mmetsp:Transcript_726/g.2056  ORF Transcript_726/g.2056 Transcript_726/m.2056 type:complete len:343 (+) Transcript_726:293-1321(+)|eukprot:CAMPEP_0198113100 /NCGR_PEP_ID=MMETSP1442-20131203/4842_1 /TAXON_ID= /ORGANISM="Craspedostauros australis, Strain CCMP3328" /LENGTH=342 /DNA_ID=CAMNT_0043770093 /DNA_START=277 /DNA_END=1305 /DNA_ORIENTATION=+
MAKKRSEKKETTPANESRRTTYLAFVAAFAVSFFFSMYSEVSMVNTMKFAAEFQSSAQNYSYTAISPAPIFADQSKYFDPLEDLHMSAAEYDAANDTSILILTSLIPTHPSLEIISKTIESLGQLVGLPHDAPIFFSIDKPETEKQPGDLDRLRQYIDNLNSTYGIHDHVTLVEAPYHLGITGNIKQSIERMTTKYVYVIQHDFAFIRPVLHKEIVHAMEKYPTTLECIRFNKRPNVAAGADRGPCFGLDTSIEDVGVLQFTKTPGWSDNNHLTTVSYYHDVFNLFWERYHQHGVNFTFGLPTEQLMRWHASRNCSKWGPHLLGPPNAPPFIRHLDGRHTGA